MSEGGGGGVAVEIGEPTIGRRRELYSGWGFEMGGLESSNRFELSQITKHVNGKADAIQARQQQGEAKPEPR